MTTIIFSYASERFGQVKKGKTKPTSYTTNRRATKIHHLCQELQILKKQYKTATDEEKQPLAELRNILQKKLMILRRAEWHQRRGRERASESLEGDLEKGKSWWPVEVCWGSVDTQRRELERHQPVSDHLTTECRREGVFHRLMKTHRVSPTTSTHQYRKEGTLEPLAAWNTLE